MSQPTPPPYGAPPGPPPPPRRRRPSGWWFVLGGGLIVAAAVAGVVLFVWTIRGFLDVDATIRADDQTHPVLLEPGEQKVLWVHESEPAICQVVDRATGDEVAFFPVSGTFTRSSGAEGWTAEQQFDAGSGQLEVTCSAAGGPAQIGPAPRFGHFLGGIFATILVPLGLGLLGALVLIITGDLFATGAPRREPRA
ncbi:MAG: hypothetical protein JWO76_987 [Nocardioides sp.]|nr:hypothetical protein [Nocardioides sp.]